MSFLHELQSHPDGVTVYCGIPPPDTANVIAIFMVPSRGSTQCDLASFLVDLRLSALWVNARWVGDEGGTLPNGPDENLWKDVHFSFVWAVFEDVAVEELEGQTTRILMLQNIIARNSTDEPIEIQVFQVPRHYVPPRQIPRRYVRSNYRRTSVDEQRQAIEESMRGLFDREADMTMMELPAPRLSAAIADELLQGEHIFAIERHGTDERYKESEQKTRVPKRGEIVMKQKGLKPPSPKKKVEADEDES